MESPSIAHLGFGPFEGLDPEIILSFLLTLPSSACINGKPFYKTYKKWSTMNVEQRTKSICFWNENLTDSVRGEILNKARSKMAEEVVEERQRQANTNKHDQARLLHLRADPAAAANWTAALREKGRMELDNRNDCQSDPWNLLAEKFNDYNTYRYSNVVVQSRIDENGRRVMLLGPGGLPVAVRGRESLVKCCFDINPCQVGRPFRDGGWIRNQYRYIKGKISLCLQNYRKSGNQAAENPYDEWAEYAMLIGLDFVYYARALFEDDFMDRLGTLNRSKELFMTIS
jgi:hypothetical protein